MIALPLLVKAVLGYAAGAYAVDVIGRRHLAVAAARKYAQEVGKPILNVGSGTWHSSLSGPKLDGDVNCDFEAPTAAACGRDKVCYCDAHDLSQWPDKHFSCVIASHILEHLPNPDQALQEWHRVADRVYIITPSWWAPHTYLHPGHRWFFPNGHAGPRVPLWPEVKISGVIDTRSRTIPASVAAGLGMYVLPPSRQLR